MEKPTCGIGALSDSSRCVVEEVIAQVGSCEEALRGVEATIVEKDLTYRWGEFVVKKTSQEQRTFGKKGTTLDDLVNLGEILTSPYHIFEELPGSKSDELCVRLTPANPKADLQSAAGEENMVITALFSRAPASLLNMDIKVVLPLLLKLLLKSQTAGIAFTYVRGVPVPKSMFLRVQTKGLGTLRLGWGSEVEIEYRE